MSDIIQDAKRLVEQGFTPPPWGVVRHDFGYDSHFIAGPVELPIKPGEPNIVRECHAALIAAAPELAQALAEETWEYAAQAKRGKDWETCTNSETHLEEWWENKDDAECAANKLQEQGHETRIVRRRVSPPEVVG